MSWRGLKSYGKSALKPSLDLNFDAYLEKIDKAKNNIDDVCAAAVDAAGEIVEPIMKTGAHKHRDNGDVEDAIEKQPVKQEGNYIYSEIGIDLKKHPEAAHALFQEYGDGHSPGFPDPFVHPATQDHKKEIRAAEKRVLKERGVPIE